MARNARRAGRRPTTGRRRTDRRSSAALALTVVLLVAAACDRGGDGDGDGSATSARTTFRGPGFSLSYPSDWRELGGDERYQRSAAVEVVPRSADGPLPPLVRVTGGAQATDFDTTVQLAKGLSGFVAPERRVLRDEPTEVAGAARARRIEEATVQYLLDGRPAPVPPAPGTPGVTTVEVRHVFVVAESSPTAALLLQAVVPAARYDELAGTLEEIVSSFRVEPA